ncbi:MAG: EI24 domain-containing protein [Pseudomonadota bacterium]
MSPGDGATGAREPASKGLLEDISRAVTQMSDRRFLGVLGISVGATLLLLMGFSGVLAWLVGFLPETIPLPFTDATIDTPFAGLRTLAVAGVLLASVFLMVPVSAVFVNLLIERIVDAVEARWYPGTAAGPDRGLLESLAEAGSFLAVLIGLNLLGLIVYLIFAPLAPVLFIALNGYLLGREFFEVVAARSMGAKDARALRRRHRFQVWFAGVLLTVPLTVPIMNLVIPVLGVATFTHMVHRLRSAAA